ncbi:MAG: GYD domain-containing protein [candidate division Zixibacteria bacterium]|nr:GYD domain-containing protein [candidate division Zixibacteria bacterium]MDD5426201.1 GYD domain-containing protein [candidate division Zixibacteria bacterium]
MALFIMALTINPSAKKMHPDLTHQVDDSLNAFKKNNVKVINLYATLGRYDYLATFEAPDQALAFKIASQINSMGILETETWPVVPYDEFSQLIK